tara:strand:+ start:381 stop:614 length:234 start_codon:yes stop_codon:yes gene_type:complete
MKIQYRLDLQIKIDSINKAINAKQKELKALKNEVALSHEIHGDRWETARFDFIKEVTERKGYTVQDGFMTKYKVIAK